MAMETGIAWIPVCLQIRSKPRRRRPFAHRSPQAYVLRMIVAGGVLLMLLVRAAHGARCDPNPRGPADLKPMVERRRLVSSQSGGLIGV